MYQWGLYEVVQVSTSHFLFLNVTVFLGNLCIGMSLMRQDGPSWLQDEG